MTDFEAVVFDLDGTLAVPDQNYERLLATAFERAGVEPLFGVGDLDAVDTAALPTARSDREFHENLFRAGAEVAGSDPGEGVVAVVADAYLDAVDPAAVSFRPGAREALATARERYDVALVTNGGEATQVPKLQRLGIADAFDAEVYCDPAAGVEPKPDPTPLRMAVDELGVAAADAVKVGDTLAADVAGAHNAGMRSAWVPQGEVLPDPEPAPTRVFESMQAFADLL